MATDESRASKGTYFHTRAHMANKNIYNVCTNAMRVYTFNVFLLLFVNIIEPKNVYIGVCIGSLSN